jgi:hypothetical protein
MKFIKLPALITAVVSCLILNSSCKKNLEEHPYSSISSSAVFNSEDGLKKATLGIYQTYVESWPTTWYRFGAAETGQQYATQGQFGDTFFDSFNKFTSSPTSNTAGELDGIWSQDYQIISRANTVIANATTAVSDTSIANKYISEARFLRGFAYFDLVRNFGGVPIIDKQITSLSQTDLIYGKRATIQATYDFIVADMLNAASELPDKRTGADLGRISAGIAKGFLGKVYLTMAGKPLMAAGYYQKAIDILSQLVGPANEAKYGFGLMPNFTDVFSNSNKRNEEILLVFSNFYTSSNTMDSIWPFFLGGLGLVNTDEQSQAGLTYKYYQLFENGDTRRDFTAVARYAAAGQAGVAAAGDSIIYNQTRLRYIDSTNHAVFGNATTNQGIVYGKFDRTPRASGTAPWSYAIDMVQMRFSDVLLSLAEAEIETGDAADALVLINRVRVRAHATPYAGTTDLEAKVRLERRLELAAEFTTVYDIRRWGTLQSEIAAEVPSQVVGGVVGTYSPKLELYPIPQTEIDVNKNLTQNPGY